MKNVSIKLKFRRSVNPEKEGSLIYQLIYERKDEQEFDKSRIMNVFEVIGSISKFF